MRGGERGIGGEGGKGKGEGRKEEGTGGAMDGSGSIYLLLFVFHSLQLFD